MSSWRRKRAAASDYAERTIPLVHDQLFNGRPFRVLTVVDQWSRWSPILEVAQSMSGSAVAEALDRAIQRHGKPRSITVDNVLTAESSPIAGTKAPGERRWQATQSVVCRKGCGAQRSSTTRRSPLTIVDTRSTAERWPSSYLKQREVPVEGPIIIYEVLMASTAAPERDRSTG
jgi:hypothetical protein